MYRNSYLDTAAVDQFGRGSKKKVLWVESLAESNKARKGPATARVIPDQASAGVDMDNDLRRSVEGCEPKL